MESLTQQLPNKMPEKPTTKVPTELVILDPKLRLCLLSQLVSK